MEIERKMWKAARKRPLSDPPYAREVKRRKTERQRQKAYWNNRDQRSCLNKWKFAYLRKKSMEM